MKKRHVVPVLGLIGSTVFSAVLVIYFLAALIARWTDILESTVTWTALALLFLLNSCRLCLILQDRDVATNYIKSRLKNDPDSEMDDD